MDGGIAMKTEIEIEIDNAVYEGHIDDERSPETAKMLLDSLPVSGAPVSWGGEFYFKVPFHIDDENATGKLEVGDIGFWPPGDVLCIFFGRTPMSVDDRPVPASAVNVVGRMFESQKLIEIGKPSAITIRVKP